MLSENYEFITDDEFVEQINDSRVYVLIIYDIVENKKRNKLAKLLQGYGFRVQKSCFEALIPKKSYKRLLKDVEPFAKAPDSIRVYKIIGKGQVTCFGKSDTFVQKEVVII